jgi:hypothetical protein
VYNSTQLTSQEAANHSQSVKFKEHSGYVLEKSRVLSSRRAILIDDFLCFPKYLEANDGIIASVRPSSFAPTL